MIDNPAQVERLLAKLNASLPLAATTTPSLAATLRSESVGTELPRRCNVIWVSYSGDEGGIVCKLDFGREGANAVFASITHLLFDLKAAPAREIAAYQKHRIKRLRRMGNSPIPGVEHFGS